MDYELYPSPKDTFRYWQWASLPSWSLEWGWIYSSGLPVKIQSQAEMKAYAQMNINKDIFIQLEYRQA